MEILQLKYFQFVAKYENISRVAKQFMVPPSSISISIKKLENEFGVQFFDRTSNKIKLNPQGKIMLELINKCEMEFKQARIDMLNLSKTPFGELNLLILTNRQIVTDYISKFKVKYPNISFKIKHEDSDYASYNNYDVIITDKIIDSPEFKQDFFLSEEILLAVHKSHRFASATKVTFSDISSENFILMPKGSSLGDYVDKIIKKAKFEPKTIIECDDPHYIRQYLNIGLGITFFPSVSWEKHITPSIKLLRVNNGIFRDSYIYTNTHSPQIANIFVENFNLI